MFLPKRRSCGYWHCKCLARIVIALNRRSVFGQANPVYKTSWASLPAKQAITVDSSSSVLNTNLLHDWSNFDLSKLYMPVEHISLMPLSCFCLSLIHTRIHASKLLITAQPIRNLRMPASAEMNKRGFLQQASLTLSPQSPSLFPFLPIPLPFSVTPAATQVSEWIQQLSQPHKHETWS